MTHSATVPLPAGLSHESLHVDAAPVIRHFLDKLGLPTLLQQHLPQLRGRQRDVPTATVLCVLLSNLLLARQPLYAIAAWAAGFVPEHLGLLPAQLPLLNDDRFGRALDHLFRADRASLLTAVVLNAVRLFRIALREMHQDTTTLTFAGAYENQPTATEADRPARITRGHNKDHRPDLKQLLYNRTLTADGAVPIHCKIHDGNTSDNKVHKETWRELCELVGGPDFLYVADTKLCDRRVLRYIARRHGRFLTMMPRTRSEHGRFLSWVQQTDVSWSEVCRKKNPRGKTKPKIVYGGFEDSKGSQEGYRIIWYRSSQKQERDYQNRMKRLDKARQQLLRLRPAGRGEHFKTEQAARAAVQRVLERYRVCDWLNVTITEVVRTEQVQVNSVNQPSPPATNNLPH
jgi:transposase